MTLVTRDQCTTWIILLFRLCLYLSKCSWCNLMTLCFSPFPIYYQQCQNQLKLIKYGSCSLKSCQHLFQRDRRLTWHILYMTKHPSLQASWISSSNSVILIAWSTVIRNHWIHIRHLNKKGNNHLLEHDKLKSNTKKKISKWYNTFKNLHQNHVWSTLRFLQFSSTDLKIPQTEAPA